MYMNRAAPRNRAALFYGMAVNRLTFAALPWLFCTRGEKDEKTGAKAQ